MADGTPRRREKTLVPTDRSRWPAALVTLTLTGGGGSASPSGSTGAAGKAGGPGSPGHGGVPGAGGSATHGSGGTGGLGGAVAGGAHDGAVGADGYVLLTVCAAAKVSA
jgi:hypothetical protein